MADGYSPLSDDDIARLKAANPAQPGQPAYQPPPVATSGDQGGISITMRQPPPDLSTHAGQAAAANEALRQVARGGTGVAAPIVGVPWEWAHEATQAEANRLTRPRPIDEGEGAWRYPWPAVTPVVTQAPPVLSGPPDTGIIGTPAEQDKALGTALPADTGPWQRILTGAERGAGGGAVGGLAIGAATAPFTGGSSLIIGPATGALGGAISGGATAAIDEFGPSWARGLPADVAGGILSLAAPGSGAANMLGRFGTTAVGAGIGLLAHHLVGDAGSLMAGAATKFGLDMLAHRLIGAGGNVYNAMARFGGGLVGGNVAQSAVPPGTETPLQPNFLGGLPP